MNNNEDQEFYAIVLGALLHDIGKFVQRSQENPKEQDHPHWGDEWFENNLSEKLALNFIEKNKQIIRSAILNHHVSEKYVSLADAISAGMDRTELKLEDEEKGDPFTDRMISIFSRISISEEPKKAKYHKLLDLGKENLKETFPIDNKKCSYKEYSYLLDALESDIKQLEFGKLTLMKLINTLHFLIWKHCWSIPSAAYKNEPDVSLFDHLKTTAAIAGCLYLYNKEIPDKPLDLESNAFYLIEGDISGIQDYIFDVLTQKGKVAKRLRARSLFVQFISEIASHKILHSFNLPLCNLLGAAGGNFYILAPNLNESLYKINALQKEFDHWTVSHLKAETAINMAGVKVSGKDLADFSKILNDKLKPSLYLKKYRSHEAVFTNNGKWFEEEFLRTEAIESDDKICGGCRKNPRIESDDIEESLCIHCLTDIKIGRELPKAKYLAFFRDNEHEYEILNYSVELWDEYSFRNAPKNKPYLILNINDNNIKESVTGFKYIASHIPINEEENQPATLDHIANKSTGDKLLACVKSDVDNLGELLRRGFNFTKPSISRFSAFSQMLEIFFSGYLNVKLKNEWKDIYTVFSGGDDFFVIGSWNQAIDFACSMRKEFSEFCSENPDMKFSAGIILTKPHDPLSYCARIVEEKLECSKGTANKDKVTLFNQTVSWHELNKIINEANKVVSWLKEKPPLISRGFAHNLHEYAEMYQKYIESGKTETRWLKFVPALICDINRNLTKKEQSEAYSWALNLSPTIMKDIEEDNLRFLKTIMGAPSKACCFLSVRVRYRQSIADSLSPMVHLWRQQSR